LDLINSEVFHAWKSEQLVGMASLLLVTNFDQDRAASSTKENSLTSKT